MPQLKRIKSKFEELKNSNKKWMFYRLIGVYIQVVFTKSKKKDCVYKFFLMVFNGFLMVFLMVF